MDHTEAIVELHGIVDNKFVKHLTYFTKCKAKKNLEVFSGLNKNVRNVKGYHLTTDTPTDMFYWNTIKKEIERLYSFYKIKFPKMTNDKVHQIDLLKYSPGGKYEIHTDHGTKAPRHLSIIINLNDNYEGGDLVFTDQRDYEIKRCKLKKGSIVFFPSNFMYPHTIESITKGTRYSIVAWLQ
jgi:predicted 2-oxoglutarate/Fe(II)-dependent dioxygenase YbiX